MTSVPPTIAAERAITQQKIALSVIKQSNDQAQAIVKILEDSLQNSPLKGVRGGNVNFQA